MVVLNSVGQSRNIGPRHPTYIIAEISANHNGSLDRALSLVRAAAEAGADAIKLQTYTADTMTIDCNSHYFRIQGTLWDGSTLYDLYREAHTPWAWHAPIIKCANELGMDCFSSPFDDTAVDFLENLNPPCYKVASFEVVDLGLLRKIAATGKPVIMSTGMATLAEIDTAVRTLRDSGTTDLVLLKCTSAYPASPAEANLRTIPHMAEAFRCPVGLSDHTMGSAVAVAAVTLGAAVVEKHFTLSRGDGGPDGAFSMEPDEFKQMVQDIRTTEAALGQVSYELTPQQRGSVVFRRSLFVVEDMVEGEVFTTRNVRSIRPGHGLPPSVLPRVLGRHATRDLPRGAPLNWDMIG